MVGVQLDSAVGLVIDTLSLFPSILWLRLRNAELLGERECLIIPRVMLCVNVVFVSCRIKSTDARVGSNVYPSDVQST